MTKGATNPAACSWLACLLGALLIAHTASAHEVRPAYLGISETETGAFSLVWKRPVREGAVLNIAPVFPGHCRTELNPFFESTSDAMIERGLLTCADRGLVQGKIMINGQAATLIDVLVRLESLSGDVRQQLLTPGDEGFQLGRDASLPVADYIGLGFEHILEGYDHLLFLVALLLVVSGTAEVVKAVTAFTVAHSITLALAALGMTSVSPTPVEACIALSIVFLAAEAIHMRRGRSSLATTKPWLVAILFGLLHGLGFAGALSEVGLPQNDIPLALLFFNFGIEAGQLLFVFVVICLMNFLQRGLAWDFRKWQTVPLYCIGAVGVYWALDRTVTMVA